MVNNKVHKYTQSDKKLPLRSILCLLQLLVCISQCFFEGTLDRIKNVNLIRDMAGENINQFNMCLISSLKF